MKRIIAVLAAIAIGGAAGAAGAPSIAAADDLAVLVYSHTDGFRHASIEPGIAAIEELGASAGFAVEATEDPAVFTDDGLQRFAAVVFLNTTGEVMPGDDARDAFEAYLRGGGGWVGVHSAADTEYDWAFYGELLGGAYFETHPLVNQSGTFDIEAHDHPSVAHLGDRWTLPKEEYYSFADNPRGRVRVLMTIDESSYLQVPNTAVFASTPFADGDASPLATGIMGDHPMSWCRDVDAGRAWYTALGHEAELFEREDYREHLLQGILTAAGAVEADCAIDTAAADTDPTPGGGADEGGAVDGTDADEADADGTEQRADASRADDEAVVQGGDATGAAVARPLPATGAGRAAPAAGLGLLAMALCSRGGRHWSGRAA
ncbi:ThuA domain-containing protein [Nitriliruptor alkaliphilus]|uniref:ThuA domain-containing protein n=1 Tax=Nitriliruptor alkaliphilus TaxID=427918 RepID=UPI000696F350|nr:ThuA domain-containing protein [Nitriliruptor alkaliphilus]